MRRLVSLVFMAALVGPAFAEDSPAPAPQPSGTAQKDAQTPDSSDLNTIICKKTGPATGSHIGGQKVCQSKKRWLELEANSQATLDKVQSGASQINGGP